MQPITPPPPRSDQLVQVTPSWAWVSLAALGLILLAACGWVAFGKVTDTVEAKGVLMRKGGLKALKAGSDGVLRKFLAVSGDEKMRGQPLAEVQAGDAAKRVSCADDIIVLRRVARESEPVKKDDVLLWYEVRDAPMRVLLYPPTTSGYRVEQGQKVRVMPSNAKQSESGYLVGEVLSAGKYPVLESELGARVQNEAMARQLLGAGPCLQVLVELDEDPTSKSRARWSSPTGKGVSLYSGIPCQAHIIIREDSPIGLLFPGLSSK